MQERKIARDSKTILYGVLAYSFFCLWWDLTPHLDLFTSKPRLFASESLGLTNTFSEGSTHLNTSQHIIFANIFLHFRTIVHRGISQEFRSKIKGSVSGKKIMIGLCVKVRFSEIHEEWPVLKSPLSPPLYWISKNFDYPKLEKSESAKNSHRY